jgi:hypothetical protein
LGEDKDMSIGRTMMVAQERERERERERAVGEERENRERRKKLVPVVQGG